MSALARAKMNAARPRPQDVDRHVGAKLRERRLTLGMTQHQMAELIGVTYQQAHKYEKGINRVAGGRLYAIAQALGVEVNYFFDGMSAEADALEPRPKQRLLLELTRNFSNITSLRQQEAICSLARALADANLDEGAEPDRSLETVIGDNTTAT